VEVSGKPMRLLVQAVGSRVSHYYDRPWTAEDERRSRLVVIGLKGLNRAAIEQILAG
jgi:cobalamin biosynthesis protein CobW